MAIAVSCLLGYLAIQFVVKKNILEPLRAKDAEITNLVSQVAAKQKELYAAQDAEYDIRSWQARSLPADLSLAQTLYQDFLRQLLEEAEISRPKIAPSAPASQGNHYRRLPFLITARTGLAQLTRFLHSFESAGYLHQIRRLAIKPVVTEGKLDGFDVSLSIEAASLPDATTEGKLPKKPERPPLKVPTLADVGVIAAKNVFQPTSLVEASVEVVEEAKTEEKDERSSIYLTATLEENGVAKVWLTNRETNERSIIAEGEPISIGGMKGTVVEISAREVLFRVDDKVGAVRLGNNLASWSEVRQGAFGPEDPVR
jgi:hypothetical protein